MIFKSMLSSKVSIKFCKKVFKERLPPRNLHETNFFLKMFPRKITIKTHGNFFLKILFLGTFSRNP